MPVYRHSLNAVKILSVLGIVLLCAFGLQAQTVVINLASFNANPSTNRNVTIQALSPTIGNLNFYISDLTTGAVEFVPNVQVAYQVVIKSPPAAIGFQIYVQSAFSGTMDATNFTSLAPNAVQTFPSAQTAPSWQAAYATFQLSGSSFSNNFPTFVQTTNIAKSVYSNNPAGYFQAVFTNGFWTTNYIGLNFYPSNNPSGYTTAGVTNGLAGTNWVGANYYPTSNPSLFTPATITNGFAPTNWVGQNFVLQSGQVTNTAGLSNSLWFAKQPASPILTNLAGLSNTNQFVFTNDTTWFDIFGTANKATNGLGGMAFQGTNGWIRTNGASALGQVPLFTNSGPGWVWATPSASGAATNAWNLGGNANLGSFIGTTTTNPFVMVANNQSGITLYSPQTYDMRITMGLSNTITADSVLASNRNSAILSGVLNTIQGSTFVDNFDGQAEVIVGGIGNVNKATGYGFIGDGLDNLLSSFPFETIVNGSSNHVASAGYGTILNGASNSIASNQTLGCQTILDGTQNTVTGIFGLIGNGSNNVTRGSYCYIVDGQTNTISSVGFNSLILDGSGNIETLPFSIIGNGIDNTNGTLFSTILNGTGNSITGNNNPVTSSQSLDILNGTQNTISNLTSGGWGTILNGQGNVFNNPANGGKNAFFNQIFDGGGNLISGAPSASSSYSFIANGNGNSIQAIIYNGDFSFILDGTTNAVASSIYSSVFGGQFNTVSNAAFSSILFGTNDIILLATNSVSIGQNQTVTNNNSVVINDGFPISTLTNNQMILSFSNGIDFRTNITVNGKAEGNIWGATTNLTLAYRRASSYYFVTNSKPYYGILTTN